MYVSADVNDPPRENALSERIKVTRRTGTKTQLFCHSLTTYSPFWKYLNAKANSFVLLHIEYISFTSEDEHDTVHQNLRYNFLIFASRCIKHLMEPLMHPFIKWWEFHKHFTYVSHTAVSFLKFKIGVRLTFCLSYIKYYFSTCSSS